MQMIETWTNLGLVWGFGTQLRGQTGLWNRSLRLRRCVISGTDCGSENRHLIRIRWLAKRSRKKSPFFFFVLLGLESSCFSRVCEVCSWSSFLLVAFVNSSSFWGNGFWCGSGIGAWWWWGCGERSDWTIRTGKWIILGFEFRICLFPMKTKGKEKNLDFFLMIYVTVMWKSSQIEPIIWWIMFSLIFLVTKQSALCFQ